MTDIERFRGDTVADQWTIKDSAGVVIDISGYTFVMTVNSLENPPDNTSELYSLTGIITDGPGGVVEFTPSAVQSDQKPAEYYYDVEMTTAGARIKTIDKGKYTYKQDISK
jgi:hypothetical protein